ncbi:MAG: DUF2226 domain-containing protein [Archaeoglobaceae archaeon]
MILPKGEAVEIGRRGRLAEVVAELQAGNFTGYVEVSYRTDELSKGRILFRNGEILAANVTKVVSKKSLDGDDALEELMEVENCVADIYALSDDKVEKAVAWNQKSLVIQKAKPKVEVEEKVGVGESAEAGLSEATTSREEVLKKYNIKPPSQEEIEALIRNALEEPLLDEEELIEEIRKLLEKSFGKAAKRAISMLNGVSSVDQLRENFDVLERELKKLTLFFPRKKVDEVLEEIRSLIGM